MAIFLIRSPDRQSTRLVWPTGESLLDHRLTHTALKRTQPPPPPVLPMLHAGAAPPVSPTKTFMTRSDFAAVRLAHERDFLTKAEGAAARKATELQQSKHHQQGFRGAARQGRQTY